ncbi:MAG: hypothetical protein SPI74_04870 [Eubacterium sp.]|nr:hypothetical protein [Eubacterium sp.]
MLGIYCLVTVTVISYFFSDFIKKFSAEIYFFAGTISLMSIYHAIMRLNGYDVEYVNGLEQVMRSISSGALGGAFFILVMYMGVFSMKYKVFKQLRKNRAELSIIACIVTLPHNIYYFFQSLLYTLPLVGGMKGIPLWTNLMMFASGAFAIAIMIPLFITSFNFVHKKIKASKWKSLQEFAYIFYAMVYVQVMMVYIGRPDSSTRTLNLIFYSVIFLSYTVLRVRKAIKSFKKKAVQSV